LDEIKAPAEARVWEIEIAGKTYAVKKWSALDHIRYARLCHEWDVEPAETLTFEDASDSYRSLTLACLALVVTARKSQTTVDPERLLADIQTDEDTLRALWRAFYIAQVGVDVNELDLDADDATEGGPAKNGDVAE